MASLYSPLQKASSYQTNEHQKVLIKSKENVVQDISLTVKMMITIRRSRCTECQICMEICSWRHFGENTTKRSRIRVEVDWPQAPVISVCLACKDQECVAACPTDALAWDHWIRLDKDRCDGCGRCAEACPVNGIHLDSHTRLPLICDTCEGEFQCVQWCPTQAIERMK